MENRVKDMYLSAFLVASGHNITDIESDNGILYFVFPDSTQVSNLINSFYMSPTANISARDYSGAIRQLKGLIHARLSVKQSF